MDLMRSSTLSATLDLIPVPVRAFVARRVAEVSGVLILGLFGRLYARARHMVGARPEPQPRNSRSDPQFAWLQRWDRGGSTEPATRNPPTGTTGPASFQFAGLFHLDSRRVCLLIDPNWAGLQHLLPPRHA